MDGSVVGIVSAGVLGIVVGSFLNVVALRFNTGLGFRGRSMCMSCGTQLSWAELIPVLSFAVQRGKCATCRTAISWQYPVVELVTGLLWAGIAARYIYPAATPAELMTAVLLFVASALLVVITVYDFKHKIIPDPLVYTFDALALASVFVHGTHLWTLLAGPILAFPFAFLWVASRGRWIGLGDAKLVLGIGWFLGISAGLNALILAFWIGAAAGVIWMLATYRHFKRRTEIPFGPFLILGMFIVLFWGVTVIDVHLVSALFSF